MLNIIRFKSLLIIFTETITPYMDEKINVLYLARWYPNKYDPMWGLFIERHARSVSALCKVSVVYVHQVDKGQKEKFITDVSHEQNLDLVRIYFKKTGINISGISQIINGIRYFRANIKGIRILRKAKGKPNIIHVNILTRAGIVALFYKKFQSIPYVITEHWTRYLPSMNNFNGSLRKLFTRIVVKNASAVTPVTYNLQQAMEKHGLVNNNYVVIPNVVDVDMFHPLENKPKNKKTQIINISCIDDNQKNILGILKVIGRLSISRQDFEFRFIGEGIHSEQMIKMAEKLNLNNSFVFFEGLKENEAVVSILNRADFMVMFSRYENLPVVILESYACGVPVISTDVGGIKEHLNDELGILIESEDEDALLEKINQIIDNHSQYNQKKIREYAVNHFSNSVIGKQIYQVYMDVLNK